MGRKVYGREPELAHWKRVTERADRREGSAWVITGPTGIGTTALARSVARKAKHDGWTVLWATGSALGSTEHGGILRQWFTPLPQRDNGRGRAFEGPGRHLVGLLDGSVDRAKDLGEATGWALHALAKKRPVLAVVDDGHWSDEASAAALVRVRAGLGTSPIVLLGTTPDTSAVPAPFRSLTARDVHVSRLQPLSCNAVSAWVDDIFNRAAPSDSVVKLARRIRERTGGLPMLMEDVLTSVALPSWMPDSARAGRVDHLLTSLTIEQMPSAPLQAIEWRLRMLGAETAVTGVLAAVAVLADAARAGAVARLLHRDKDWVEHELKSAKEARLAEKHHGVWSCSHPLVADAVLRSASLRGDLSARAAQLLLERGASAYQVEAHQLEADSLAFASALPA